jgi:hypothetical protein
MGKLLGGCLILSLGFAGMTGLSSPNSTSINARALQQYSKSASQKTMVQQMEEDAELARKDAQDRLQAEQQRQSNNDAGGLTTSAN